MSNRRYIMELMSHSESDDKTLNLHVIVTQRRKSLGIAETE